MLYRNFDILEFAKQANQFNTINGGIVSTQFKIEQKEDEAIINVQAASVDGGSYDVIINNNLLFIYSVVKEGEDLIFNEEKNPVALPIFNKVVEIPHFVEAEEIHAEITGNQLKVHLPYKGGDKTRARRINIRHL